MIDNLGEDTYEHADERRRDVVMSADAPGHGSLGDDEAWVLDDEKPTTSNGSIEVISLAPPSKCHR